MQKKVFISYSDEPARPEHQASVLTLADALRRDGHDCTVDQHLERPPTDADVVLLVCTQSYARRVRKQERPGAGNLAPGESEAMSVQLVGEHARTSTFIPIVFRDEDCRHVPKPLVDKGAIKVDANEGYQRLCREIAGDTPGSQPPIEEVKPMAFTHKAYDALGEEQITMLLNMARAGDRDAGERLANAVYRSLKAVAANQLRAGPNPGLQTTELVNLAYQRLLEYGRLDAPSRRELFGIFERAMRDVLIDQYRAAKALKRGGKYERIPLVDEHDDGGEQLDVDILDLLEGLDKLRAANPVTYEAVSFKYLCGLRSIKDLAEVIGCTVSDARERWEGGRRYLYAWLSGKGAFSRQRPPQRE